MSEIKKLEEHVGANAICICDYGQNEYTLSIGAIAEINKAFDALNAKLAQRRQAVEDGRVVELPCRGGDVLYEGVEDGIAEALVIGIGIVCELDFNGIPLKSTVEIEEIGKTVFLTRAEAEAAILKEGTE